MDKCKNYKSYKGVRAPTCGEDKHGCVACRRLYVIRNFALRELDRVLASIKEGELAGMPGLVRWTNGMFMEDMKLEIGVLAWNKEYKGGNVECLDISTHGVSLS